MVFFYHLHYYKEFPKGSVAKKQAGCPACLPPCFPRLKFVAEGGADVTRIAVAVLTEAELVAVFFVEEVFHVELRAEVVVDLVARHDVGYRIAVLPVFDAALGRGMLRAGVGAALPVDAAAQGQPGGDGGGVVGGKEFELFLGAGGVDGFALRVFALPLAVAGAEFYGVGYIAARFYFKAVHFCAFGSVVGLGFRCYPPDFVAAVSLREVVLAALEDGGLGVQAVVQEAAFPADFLSVRSYCPNGSR